MQSRCECKRQFNAEIAQLVERNLAKVEVAGPSPVFRSKKKDDLLVVLLFFGYVLLAAPYSSKSKILPFCSFKLSSAAPKCKNWSFCSFNLTFAASKCKIKPFCSFKLTSTRERG